MIGKNNKNQEPRSKNQKRSNI